MPMLASRRLLAATLTLTLAALACAYADVPIEPAAGQALATPVSIVASFTPAPTGTATPAPSATGDLPTDTATPAPTPTGIGQAPTEIGQAATDAPPTATNTRVVEVTASNTPTTGATSGTPSGTTTPEGPTAEPSATLDPGLPTPTLAAIPLEATFTRTFTATAEGDFPYGLPRALNDAQVSTWVSLRNGQGVWTFDLISAPVVGGVRLYAHRDRDQDTTLLGIDVSLDGATWATVYAPTTNCETTPNCAVIPQDTYFDLPFGPLPARYVRLRSGPTAMALAEVQFALMP
jgi:hypothetical protein